MAVLGLCAWNLDETQVSGHAGEILYGAGQFQVLHGHFFHEGFDHIAGSLPSIRARACRKAKGGATGRPLHFHKIEKQARILKYKGLEPKPKGKAQFLPCLTTEVMRDRRLRVFFIMRVLSIVEDHGVSWPPLPQ